MSDADLDKKLREILANMRSDQVDDLELPAVFQQDRYAEAIAEIKQAFADEGYQKYTTYTKITTADGVVAVQRGLTVMTGQEWYERFVEEFNTEYLNNPRRELADPTKVVEAAKRAAGIDN